MNLICLAGAIYDSTYNGQWWTRCYISGQFLRGWLFTSRIVGILKCVDRERWSLMAFLICRRYGVWPVQWHNRILSVWWPSGHSMCLICCCRHLKAGQFETRTCYARTRTDSRSNAQGLSCSTQIYYLLQLLRSSESRFILSIPSALANCQGNA